MEQRVNFWTIAQILEATQGRLWLFQGREVEADFSQGEEATILSENYFDICTDSRRIQTNQAYLPLKGTRFDGEDFFGDVLQKGGKLLLLRRPPSPELLAEAKQRQASLLQVEPVTAPARNALEALAKWKRQQQGKWLLGISGSVGKTSTKEMIAAGLSAFGEVHKTAENLNNEIGMASTLLACPSTAQSVVLELGMDHAGELGPMSRLARPDAVLLTNIGHSHLANFSSQADILQAKLELLEGLPTKAHLLLPLTDPLLESFLREDERARHWPRSLVSEVSEIQSGELRLSPQHWLQLYGRAGDSLFEARNIQLDAEGKASFEVWLLTKGNVDEDAVDAVDGTVAVTMNDAVDGETETADNIKVDAPAEKSGQSGRRLANVDLPVPGRFHIRNALFAFAAALARGYIQKAEDYERLARGLLNFQQLGNRQRRSLWRGVTIIDDSYNAAVESIEASVESLCEQKQFASQQRRLVLAGIAELGTEGEQLQEALGRRLYQLPVGHFYLIGEGATALLRGLQQASEATGAKDGKRISYFADKASCVEQLRQELQPGDALLLKASHCYALHEIREALEGEEG